MPDADGYALIQRLRRLESERARAIPAIALTAFSRETDRAEILASGFQMHLAKPVDLDELITAIGRQVKQFNPGLN